MAEYEQDELIDLLRNTTQLARLNRGEINTLLQRMREEGYEVVKISSVPVTDLPSVNAAPEGSDV